MKLDIKNLNGEAKRLSEFLKSKIISQREAIDEVCNGAQKYFSGISDPKKPISNFLFAGPTGSGKTQLVNHIGEFFGLDPVVINCGEMQDKHELSKLLGAPPGYIGHGDTKPLLSKEKIELKGKPNVILFDEIEKTSPALYNMLLGILDNGYVTTNSNVDVYFNNCFIFMTCNIGIKTANKEEAKMGFVSKTFIDNEKEEFIIKEIKKEFSPEFFNRIDKTIVFKTLTKEDVFNIFDLELFYIQERLANCEAKKIFFSASDDVKEKLVNLSYSPEYGARSLKRTLEKEIVLPLSNALSLDEVEDGDYILMSMEEDGEFFFTKEEYTRQKGSSVSISMIEINAK